MRSVPGWIAVLRNRSNEAIADGELAIALQPSNILGYIALADICNMENRRREALGYAPKWARPKHPEGFMNEAGFACAAMGRFQESIKALKAGQAGNPWVHFVADVDALLCKPGINTERAMRDVRTSESARSPADDGHFRCA